MLPHPHPISSTSWCASTPARASTWSSLASCASFRLPPAPRRAHRPPPAPPCRSGIRGWGEPRPRATHPCCRSHPAHREQHQFGGKFDAGSLEGASRGPPHPPSSSQLCSPRGGKRAGDGSRCGRRTPRVDAGRVGEGVVQEQAVLWPPPPPPRPAIKHGCTRSAFRTSGARLSKLREGRSSGRRREGHHVVAGVVVLLDVAAAAGHRVGPRRVGGPQRPPAAATPPLAV